MRIHTFPEHYGEECVLVELDKAFVPIVVGQIELLLQRRYWNTDADYYQGHSAAAEAIAAMANSCLQQIVDSVDRLYRLHAGVYYGDVFVPDENGNPPALPAIPPYDPNYSTLQLMFDKIGDLRAILSVLAGVLPANPNYFGIIGDELPTPTTYVDILNAITALSTLLNGQTPLDYTSVLGQIAFNTNLTRSNAGVISNLTLRQLCCDLASVEPIPSTAPAPGSEQMCAGLQAIADAYANAMDALYRYMLENDYIDATGVALIVNREFTAKHLPLISQASASQLAGRMLDLLPGGTPWNQFFGDVQKETLRSALLNATDASQARALYLNWVETQQFIPYEIQQIEVPLGRDQAVWNALFDGTIDTTGYDGSICGGGGGDPPGEQFTLYSARGHLAFGTHPDDPFPPESDHEYLQFVALLAYRGSTEFSDSRWYFQVDRDVPANVLGTMPCQFDTSWSGVQVKIASGPEDVSLIFFEGGPAPIGLSSTSWTTLGAEAINFLCYSPTQPDAQFTLLAIFP